MNTISVVIPSYNSVKTIGRTLEALSRQKYVSEVIVVDSSDDLESIRTLESFQSGKVKITRILKKTPPGDGRNIGAEKAISRILAFVDSDSYVVGDWSEQILKAYESGHLVGGGSIEVPSFQKNRWLPMVQYFLQSAEFMNRGSCRSKRFVPSCNLYCDREIFRQVGGFPRVRATEDVLFGLRVNKISKVWFIPQAMIYHEYRESLKAALRNEVLLGKYTLIYRRMETPDKFYYRGLWPLLFLQVFMLIKAVRMTARVLGSDITKIVQYIVLSPLVFLGLCFWGYGFAQGTMTHKSTE